MYDASRCAEACAASCCLLACSRLYTRVLNYYHWVQSCSSFNNTLNNSGLVGIQASCEPHRAAEMLNIMCRKCCSVGIPFTATLGQL